MKQALETYKKYRKKMIALSYVNFVTSWDMQTEAADKSIEADSEQQGVLAEMEYELHTAQEFEQAVETLFQHKDELDDVMKHEVEVLRKDIEDTKKIPVEEYTAFSELTSKAYPVYVKAKRENNFALFRPYLEQIMAFRRKQVKWLETDKLKGYDILLDSFEPHFTTKQYDKFFDALKTRLVPFVKKVTAVKHETPKWATDSYPVDKQREFCEYLRDVMCFDKSCGIMKQSEHPFTSGFGTQDVRITNHYHEHDFTSAIFSCIHETGHATYEHQVDEQLNDTFSGGGASLGMHESQSRFYENIIGRSYAFWKTHFPKLKDTFPTQLKDVTLDEFVSYINTAQCSFIRTEADELTYPLHVMLRYDLEKEMITGKVEAENLPKRWNEKFNEYFGITPPTDTLGVLQDVHWAYGELGYFPTYALGSAISAQLFHYMNKDFDVYKSLESGTTQQINDWLKTHVHKYGSSKYPDEILKLATGEDFNPDYYIDYLINKYSK